MKDEPLSNSNANENTNVCLPIMRAHSIGGSLHGPMWEGCTPKPLPACSQPVESIHSALRQVFLPGRVEAGFTGLSDRQTIVGTAATELEAGATDRREKSALGSVCSNSIVLICPGARPAVQALAQNAPLALAPMLGKTLLEHWLDQLADSGVRHVCLLASDRPEQVRAWLGDGVRWEMKVELIPEARESTIAEARAKYSANDLSDSRAKPDDALLMDFLPGAPERPLFRSYADWFSAVTNRLPQAASAPDRIGVRELQSGIWAGLHSRISPDAELRAPCWIGENVVIAPRAIVGPGAIVEDGTVLAADAEVANSIVGPGTYVGEFTEVKNSLASGSTLINWQSGSCIQVPDAFLLSPLDQRVTTARVDHWLRVHRISFGNHP